MATRNGGPGSRSATSPAGGDSRRIPRPRRWSSSSCWPRGTSGSRRRRSRRSRSSRTSSRSRGTRSRAIRGVNSEGVLRALVDRGLVVEVGREETPGRPVLYGTTPEFLERLGLPSLSALPALAPLLRAGGGRRTGRDGRHRLRRDARRAAPAFARPRRVRVAPRVRGGDRRRARRDQRAGRDAGRPARSRGRRGAGRRFEGQRRPRAPHVRVAQAARRHDDDARPPRRTRPQRVPPQGRARVPGRSPRPGHRGAVAADQRRFARAPAHAPAVRDREGVPGRGGQAPVPAPARASAPRRRARRRDRAGDRCAFGGREVP